MKPEPTTETTNRFYNDIRHERISPDDFNWEIKKLMDTARTEAATEAAFDMRERAAVICRGEKNELARGVRDLPDCDLRNNLLRALQTATECEKAIRALPVEGVSERQEDRDTLLQECRVVLRKAEFALSRCYDVTEFPADGESIQDKAIAECNALLARLPEAKEE